MHAYVFLNPTMPLGLGHVGWGYEYKTGIYRYGAVEIVTSIISAPDKPNACFNETAHEADMLKNMRTGKHGGSGFVYMKYKKFDIPSTSWAAADAVAEAQKRKGYLIAGNNCMDATYNVIVAYAKGNHNILPWPSTHWFPNHFFGDIRATEHHL